MSDNSPVFRRVEGGGKETNAKRINNDQNQSDELYEIDCEHDKEALASSIMKLAYEYINGDASNEEITFELEQRGMNHEILSEALEAALINSDMKFSEKSEEVLGNIYYKREKSRENDSLIRRLSRRSY